MLKRITTSRTSAGNLNLIYLNNQNLPCAFEQTGDGVWHGGVNGGPIQIPTQPGLSFQAIRGLNNGYGLVALDYNNQLWFTTQQGDTWNQQGFSLLPNFTPGQFLQGAWSMNDFDVCEVPGLPLSIAISTSLVIFDPPPAGVLWTQYGALSNMSQLASVNYWPGTVGQGQPLVTQPVFSVAAIGGNYFPGTQIQAMVIDGSGLSGASTYDGIHWVSMLLPNPTTTAPEQGERVYGWNCSGTVVALGNPNGTLQVICLNGDGYLYLFYWSHSGPFVAPPSAGFVFYGMLPNPDNLFFSKVAASIGADGHFQVVGISNGLPYLTWADANGTWGTYVNPQGQGMQLPMNSDSAFPLQDLAMGFGNQGYLQVGYLGNDGNIYVNWQDFGGNWGWYGPLP